MLARRIGIERALLVASLGLAGGIGLRSMPAVTALFVGTAVLSVAIAVGNVLLPALVKRGFPASIGIATSSYVTVMGWSEHWRQESPVPIARAVPGGWRASLAVWVLPALLASLGCASTARSRPTLRTGFVPIRRSPFPVRQHLAWMVTLFTGLQSLGFFVVVAWLPTILRDRGRSADVAGWHQSGYKPSPSCPTAGRRPADGAAVTSFCLAALLQSIVGLLAGSGSLRQSARGTPRPDQ